MTSSDEIERYRRGVRDREMRAVFTILRAMPKRDARIVVADWLVHEGGGNLSSAMALIAELLQEVNERGRHGSGSSSEVPGQPEGGQPSGREH